jgi:hypothetical protein
MDNEEITLSFISRNWYLQLTFSLLHLSKSLKNHLTLMRVAGGICDFRNFEQV